MMMMMMMMMMNVVLIVNILNSSSSNRSMHIRHHRLTRRGLILPVHTVIHYVLIELFVYATAGHPARMPTLADYWQGSGLFDACTVSSKLHASLYHVLPPVSTISGYATGLRKLSVDNFPLIPKWHHEICNHPDNSVDNFPLVLKWLYEICNHTDNSVDNFPLVLKWLHEICNHPDNSVDNFPLVLKWLHEICNHTDNSILYQAAFLL